MPSWVPWKKDGDDSDAAKGMMDEYGYCEDLTVNISDTIIYENDGYTYGDLERSIKICRGATVSLYGDIMCQRESSITVEANSTLIVDGSTIRNAIINLKPQSHLIIRNGGEIYLRNNHSLEIPLSATSDISEGAIYNRTY